MANKSAYVSRLGLHHFAHLRAVAEGLPVVDAAKRYLGVEHGHQAKVAHLETRDAVRAVARRRGLSAWRLIGIALDMHILHDGTPSLQEFIESRDLDDWSEADVLQMYQEIYPASGKQLHRQRVRTRLRERLLETLHELEALAAEQPQPVDAISGWFDAMTAAKLLSADMVILAQLQERIAIGGRWWRDLPGIGRTKAQRIESHLTMLLSEQPLPKPRVVFSLSKRVQSPCTPSDLLVPMDLALSAQPMGDDKQAIEAWVAAKAGSAATVKAYTREAMRLLLWLSHERGGTTFRQMTLLDCRDYMAFLQHIPAHWMSRARAQPGSPGWAPFRGPLSTRSVRQAITIVVSMFHWLQASGYIAQNPWLLVNQKIGDDRQERVLQSKALSEVATREVIAFCQNKLPEPAAQRMLFIVQFVTSVGLRSAELLSAKLADVQHEEEGWVMQVHGKGSKNRIVALPPAALQALNTYLQARSLGDITCAPPQAPVLASLHDPSQGVGYQALYQHVKSWLGKAIDVADLPTSERMRLRQASTHWLRHTFGTRAIAKEVPLDVIQAQMGHASIQTTTAIYGRAPMRRRIDEMDRAFG
jgi:site-specific recombinase XerD